jgi:ubiquinone/menaquinone biosynthesis C-methylase UbiE
MVTDYRSITELPQSLLSGEQALRMAHRYHMAAEMASTQRVLEVACGAGSGLGLLAKVAHSLCAVDYTRSVLHVAKDHYGRRVPLAQADAQDLPFEDGSFDLLLCFEAIYYLPDYRRFLHESRRILAPGGRMLLSLSNPSWPDFVPGAMTTHYPNASELAESLVAAGFDDVQLFGILPTSASTAGDRLRHRLRRLALRINLPALLGPFSHPLKHLLYSRLHPLPAELDARQAAILAQTASMAAVSSERLDSVHRVLYACASR